MLPEPSTNRFLVRTDGSPYVLAIGCACAGSEVCSPVQVADAIGCSQGELDRAYLFVEPERADEDVVDRQHLEIRAPGSIDHCEATPELLERREALSAYLRSLQK